MNKAAPALPLRVILAAENASVRFGGEAILPYHYFRLLRARGVDAHLVVHERCREELEALFGAELERLHFVADQPLQKVFFKLGRALPRRLDEASFGLANQMLTQSAQRRVIERLAQTTQARCVVHQPIPVSPRTPSLLSGLGVPLIVGPMNGGMEYPPAFRSQESRASRIAIGLARSLTDVGNALFPGKRHAQIVLVANARTRAALPARLSGQVIELPENGVDPAQWLAPVGEQPARATAGPGRFLFIGRLVDWKALDIALDAMKTLPGAQLEVVGDGPMHAPWQAHAIAAGLSERVHFLGWKSQAACATLLTAADALLLPSLFECGGAVVLEAMAMQRPVIATDWGGPADYLDESCGILVPPASREALVAGFTAAMQRLAAEPDLRVRMGVAGRERLLREFNWERKVDTMISLYEAIAATRALRRG